MSINHNREDRYKNLEIKKKNLEIRFKDKPILEQIMFYKQFCKDISIYFLCITSLLYKTTP